MSARRPKKQLIALLELIRRVDPGHMINGERDRLTVRDRQLLADLLRKLASDQDVRDEYFSSIANRPRADEALKSAAAFVYFAQIELGEREKGSALVTEIAKRGGLSRGQVEHAIRDHKRSSLAWIETLRGDRRMLVHFANLNILTLRRNRREK